MCLQYLVFVWGLVFFLEYDEICPHITSPARTYTGRNRPGSVTGRGLLLAATEQCVFGPSRQSRYTKYTGRVVSSNQLFLPYCFHRHC